ncbi:unnamed protein product, partial [Coregonus sp. 'balchen']
ISESIKSERRGVQRLFGVARDFHCVTNIFPNIRRTTDANHEMAFRDKVADTRTVLVHLLLCLVIFYSLYYMIGSVCFGAFSDAGVSLGMAVVAGPWQRVVSDDLQRSADSLLHLPE